MKKKLNDASPADWDRARDHYLRQLEEEEIICSPREHLNFPDNVRPDMVDKPPHYNQGGIECIDYIKQQLGDTFIDYCQGNVIKYLHRWRYKNGIEDLKKAQWYLQAMIDNV